MATLVQILSKKWYGTLWTLSEDNYSTLNWFPENTLPKPTEAEIRAFDAEVSLELRWDIVREQRTALLLESDWTQLNNAPLTAEQVLEWANYRQALRNIPQQGVDPENVVWPSKP